MADEPTRKHNRILVSGGGASRSDIVELFAFLSMSIEELEKEAWLFLMVALSSFVAMAWSIELKLVHLIVTTFFIWAISLGRLKMVFRILSMRYLLSVAD